MGLLYNKKLNISEEDVKACYDKATLLNWEHQIKSDISDAKSYVQVSEENQSIKDFIRHQTKLSRIVSLQLSLLSSQTKVRNRIYDLQLIYLRKVLKSLVNEEEYNNHIAELDKIVSENTHKKD